MNTEDRKRLAGCIAILSGCFSAVIVLVILFSFAIGIGVKVFRMVGH